MIVRARSWRLSSCLERGLQEPIGAHLNRSGFAGGCGVHGQACVSYRATQYHRLEARLLGALDVCRRRPPTMRNQDGRRKCCEPERMRGQACIRVHAFATTHQGTLTGVRIPRSFGDPKYAKLEPNFRFHRRVGRALDTRRVKCHCAAESRCELASIVG